MWYFDKGSEGPIYLLTTVYNTRSIECYSIVL